jgi:hypothetical protein
VHVNKQGCVAALPEVHSLLFFFLKEKPKGSDYQIGIPQVDVTGNRVLNKKFVDRRGNPINPIEYQSQIKIASRAMFWFH